MLSLVALLVPAGAKAQVAKQGNTSLDGLAFTSPRLSAGESLDTLDNVQGLLPANVANAWAAFRLGANGEWNALVDKRTGRIEIAEGAGIPTIPGRGNSLTPKDVLAQLGTTKVDLAGMDTLTRAFLPRVATLLGVDPAALVLNKGRSGQQADYLWFVDYDVLAANGSLIEGARVVFRFNHGNLVQFGTENMPAGATLLPREPIRKEVALANLARYIGGFTASDSFLDDGSAHTLALGNIDNRFADGFQFGNGRGIGQVWELTFHRDGVMGNWRARVDASTGEVLELKDVNDYATAQVTGGVYLNSPTTGAEVVRPMPYADVSGVGAASSAGTYNFTGGTPVSTLNGTYVRITDTCGAISQAADGSGNIAFGTSGGTDCTTPGHGGAGNTHSSRSQFYSVNRIKEVGRGWLPTNTWLGAKLTVNVNLNQTCNAYWNGSTLNFFRSGGGCNNTGEIAAVSLHEYGHGLDQNDGTGTAPEGGTGESYGDTTSVIALHNSCIGPGFLTSNCGGYGDACTACTGVRDVDYAKHASNTPATVSSFTQVRCGAGSGPCGKEVHCESYVPSEAIWDFANRDLPGAGTGPAWTVLDRLWYLSRNTATSSFTCHTGGTFTSDGCGTGNWWKTMRAVDDDDGNLANGTPHGGALFAAFNRHGIACTTDAGASTTFAGCTAPTPPALTLTAGDSSAGLSWTNSGTGVVYDLYRNEAGCNAGFTKIVNDATGTSFTDNAVANGLTYYYQVIAHPTGTEACGGAPSTCQSVTPSTGPCTPPAAPTGLTATTVSATAINLAWTAVSGATEYHILRSTTSGGPYAQVGTSTTASFSDTGLTCNTTYYYVVRAANSGTCESGNSAQASATTSTCPVCTTTTLYSHNFDAASGLDGWSNGTFVTGGSTVDWRGVQTCTAHSGARIFRFGGTGCSSAYGNNRFSFSQPNGAAGITVPAGSTVSRLSFWHRRGFESGYDGGTLTVSVDGTNYSFVPSSAVLTGGYSGTISAACPPAGAAGASAWTGSSSTFTNTTVDLDAACNAATGTSTGCAGRAVRIGFTGITDCSVTSSGWFLDDVVVTACVP